jgi:hypothetical protein
VMTGMSSGTPICVTPPAPTDCGAGQALTYTANGFACVTVDQQIVPTCGAGQFLTSNGSSFTCTNTAALSIGCPGGSTLTGISNGQAVCANLPSISVPACGAGQYVAGNGSQLYCADLPSIPTCGAGQYVAGDGNQLTCANLPTARCSTAPWGGLGGEYLTASSVPTGAVFVQDSGCGYTNTYVCDNGGWTQIAYTIGTINCGFVAPSG